MKNLVKAQDFLLNAQLEGCQKIIRRLAIRNYTIMRVACVGRRDYVLVFQSGLGEEISDFKFHRH